jgi:hypothetical protein
MMSYEENSALVIDWVQSQSTLDLYPNDWFGIVSAANFLEEFDSYRKTNVVESGADFIANTRLEFLVESLVGLTAHTHCTHDARRKSELHGCAAVGSAWGRDEVR